MIYDFNSLRGGVLSMSSSLKNGHRRKCRLQPCALTVVLALLPALSGQDALRGWTATGQTDVLALMMVQDSGLVFRNMSSKTVTAFAVSFLAANDDT